MAGSHEQWACECRQCRGVFDSATAVQYVWEYALGAVGVPFVVGVYAHADGSVLTAWGHRDGEPDEPADFDVDYWMVSCRPGATTVPTEGDVAQWVRWARLLSPPNDWLIADGVRWRSVRAVVEALHARTAMPEEQCCAGDWWGTSEEERAVRAELREGLPAADP